MTALLGTVAAIIAFTVACFVPAGLCLLFSRWFSRERPRPPLPSDDVFQSAFGDVANLPSLVFHKPENDR